MYKQKCHVNLILSELICISAFEKYSLKSPEYRWILARSTNVPLNTLGTGSEPCQQNIASENTTDITSHLVIMYGFTHPLFICTCQYDRQKKVKKSITVLNYSILKLYALLKLQQYFIKPIFYLYSKLVLLFQLLVAYINL